MSYQDKIKRIESIRGSYFSDRISAEVAYAARLSYVNGKKYDNLIESVADFLIQTQDTEGTITNQTSKKAEAMLAPISADAKKIKVHAVSHAHIDMNWMWGFHETAAITVETFRTMLDLMKEYKDFTFSQSQASTYKIIEDYCPEMLEEIKMRIKEGRWEVSASTWTETDKNMPNGESFSRHILYTKRYMKELFGINPEDLKLDFEPDTFGHNLSIPDILCNGGVKYYYMCRGYSKELIYNWKSPSGAKVLVYREPKWYNADINAGCFNDLPIFCKEYNIDVSLKVYGVGDHGGGPTRRDIERLIDMQSWPIMPEIVFSTYYKFFAELEVYKTQFNTVEKELNFVFTGCYTSQSRIKMANRISEARLFEVEALSGFSTLLGGKDYGNLFKKAWENVLFNHFHDIIPGSGVTETREYALGLFQQTMAHVNASSSNVMRYIASQIDTSSVSSKYKDMPDSNSEGAGVGYSVGDANTNYHFPRTERGSGAFRIFHLFNNTQYNRNEAVSIFIWDLPYESENALFTDVNGNEIEAKFIRNENYWGHRCGVYMLYADVAPFSYKTYLLNRREYKIFGFGSTADPRTHEPKDNNIVMQNEQVYAEFDRLTMKLISYIDKTSGIQLINKPSAYYNFIIEDHRSNAWEIGAYMKVCNINEVENVRLHSTSLGGIYQSFIYEIRFMSSVLKVTVSLGKNSKTLQFVTDIDWREQSGGGQSAPLLTFNVPFAYTATDYKYDIANGFINRPDTKDDRPAGSIVAAITNSKATIAVVNDTRYGYRCTNNSIALSLVHTSHHPDPHPETDSHHIKIGIAALPDSSNETLLKLTSGFNHPVAYVTNKPHTGTLPFDTLSSLSVEGSVQISSIKTPEDESLKNKGYLIVRLYEYNGNDSSVTLKFNKEVCCVKQVDIVENEYVSDNITDIIPEGCFVKFNIKASCSTTLLIRLP